VAGEDENVLVEIDGLIVNFYTYQGVVQAIEGVDLVITKGETLGLVGETGCGKSVTASAIMSLILSPPGKIEEGSIYFLEPAEVRARRRLYEGQAQEWYSKLPPAERKKMVVEFGTRHTGFRKWVRSLKKEDIEKLEVPDGAPFKLVKSYLTAQIKKASKQDKVAQDALTRNYNLLTKPPKYMQKIRGKFISMIFQEPTSALNPVFTAGDQIAEVILQHRRAEMAAMVIKRIDAEKAVLAKPASALRAQAEAWWDILPELERKQMVAAYGSWLSVYRSRGRPVTAAQIQKAVAPVKPPKNVVRAYISKKRRPHKLSASVDRIADKEKPEKRGVCSVCHSEVSGEDPWCNECGTQFYGRLAWFFRGFVLATWSEIFKHIQKNPESKNLLMSRVPLLRRYRNELETEALREAVKMLEIVRIPDPMGVALRYPFELSGGMQQRVMIAMALACNPRLLIADEPTTALDVTIQGQILKLMRDLKKEYGSSILLITHNLGVVAEMCDRVGVMYAGSIAEIGPSRAIFKSPLHPYTTGLMRSVPSIQMEAEKLYTIRGSVPNLIYPPSGCRFHPRCDYAKEYCKSARPVLKEVVPGHKVSCHMVTKEEGYVTG